MSVPLHCKGFERQDKSENLSNPNFKITNKKDQKQTERELNMV